METINEVRKKLLDIVQSYKDTNNLTNNDLVEYLGIDRIKLVKMYQDSWNPTLTEIYNIIEKCHKTININIH